MSKNSEMAGRLTGAILLLALTAGLTGCGKAVEDYSVVGATNEVSQVTSEPFSAIYPTMEYAKDDEDEIREILVGSGLDHVNGFDWHDEEVGAIASVRLSSTCVLVARWKFHARVRR